MPWWGWLILVCVALVVAGWVTVVLVSARAIARQVEADDRRHEEFRRRMRP